MRFEHFFLDTEQFILSLKCSYNDACSYPAACNSCVAGSTLFALRYTLKSLDVCAFFFLFFFCCLSINMRLQLWFTFRMGNCLRCAIFKTILSFSTPSSHSLPTQASKWTILSSLPSCWRVPQAWTQRFKWTWTHPARVHLLFWALSLVMPVVPG